MRMSRRFAQLDVFADRPGAGNPLAVVLDAQDLDEEAMQALANWTNLSETTFLLPPTRPEASYRVRIFTPRQELPFAGHPSVGSAHAAIEAGLVVPDDGHLVQECSAGLLPIRVDGEGDTRRIFVRAPQGRALTLTPDQQAWSGVLDGLQLGALPAVLMDNGPQWWVVELADEGAVRSMVPDLAAIGAWLQQKDALRARRYVASQGREVGRDGRVHVEVDNLRNVWVGGQTQTVVNGELEW